MLAALNPIVIRLDGIDTRLNGIDTRLDGIELLALHSMNGSVTLPTDRLTPPARPAAPAIFPATLADLLILSSNNCDLVIMAYNIPVPAGLLVNAKRRTIAEFIGIRFTIN
jgi:hypothetical protein